jgi:hypothetical protein
MITFIAVAGVTMYKYLTESSPSLTPNLPPLPYPSHPNTQSQMKSSMLCGELYRADCDVLVAEVCILF